MLKGFQDTRRGPMFRGFPSLHFQQNNAAYGFSGVRFWMDAAYGLNTQSNGAGVGSWADRINPSLVFRQETAGSQPLLTISDVDFNGHPSLNLTGSRRVQSAVGTGILAPTIAFIVKNTSIGSVNYFLSQSSFSNGMITLGGTNTGHTGIGFCNDAGGGQTAVYQSTVEDTNTHIVVIGKSYMVIDGVVARSDVSPLESLLFTSIGHSTSGRSSNNKVSEIIGWNIITNSAQGQELCNTINQKYLIY